MTTKPSPRKVVHLAGTRYPLRLDAHGTYEVDEELLRDELAARKAGRWLLVVLALFLATFAGLVGVVEWMKA